MKVGATGEAFVSVRWFSKPVYPLGTPLVVRVQDDGSAVQSEFGCIIRLNQIEPSRVMVEHPVDPRGTTFYMMRDSGYDKIGRIR